MEQVAFGTESFANNPEPRCLCVLVLDTSGSMAGAPIAALNAGIAELKNELAADGLAQKRVELSIVTFGPVTEMLGCVSVENFVPPTLSAASDTPMGGALLKAVEIAETRKQAYKAGGVKYYRPWIMLITDGGPTDQNTADWPNALQKIQDGVNRKAFAFFPIGVENADMTTLATVCPSVTPIKLQGLKFRELFRWLSSSLKSVSQSRPGEDVKLASPTAPNGWGTV